MGRTIQVSNNSFRPQAHSAQHGTTKLQQCKVQQQQLTSSKSSIHANKNAQVYRPTPVTEHPDDAFVTGAWLFDQSRIPQWMQSQLPASSTRSLLSIQQQQTKQQQQHHQQQQQTLKPTQVKLSTNANLNAKVQPMKTTSVSNAKVIRPTPVYEHPDTAFFSGAWLFDTARTPLWMQRELPTVATALVRRSPRRLASALPTARSQRARSATKHYATALPNLKAFGATPYAVIPCGSVKAHQAHPDDAFYSGAWMFDATCAPAWFVQELRGTTGKQAVHVQKQKTTSMQYAGVKLTSGRKLAV